MAIDDTGNGIVIQAEGRRYRLDPAHAVEGDENIVSHAHSDHVPHRIGRVPIVCSDATFDLISQRRKSLRHDACGEASLVEAGHVPGSKMVLLGCDVRVLYTGDFCTRRKRHVPPAEPHPCDVLVLETTYGKEGYEFPEHEETIGAISDWVDSTLASGRCTVLLAYPLGKAQELAYELRGRPLRMQRSICENNRVLAAHGLRLPTDGLEDCPREQPFVYITSGLGKESARVARLVKDGARTASFSGWSVNRFGGGAQQRTDEEFPLSDHCDYNELLEFVRLCGPERVLTTHGFATEFAKSVRKELGIEATALRKGQWSLDSFA